MTNDLNLLDLMGEEETAEETTEVVAETVEEEVTESSEPVAEVLPEQAVEVTEEKEEEDVMYESTVEVTEETVDESGLDAPSDSEVTSDETPESKKESETLDEQYIDTASFLIDNAGKIENARCVPITGIESIPVGKYLLYVTNQDDDADMILIEAPNRLAFEKFDPEKIVVEKSGVIAISKEFRTYVTKTNVVQYKVNSYGSPVSVNTFRKIAVSSANPKVDTKNIDVETKTVDEIKLHITSVSAPLAKNVKELTTVDELRKATVEFMDSIVDINYLIKINNMMMQVGI